MAKNVAEKCNLCPLLDLADGSSRVTSVGTVVSTSFVDHLFDILAVK